MYRNATADEHRKALGPEVAAHQRPQHHLQAKRKPDLDHEFPAAIVYPNRAHFSGSQFRAGLTWSSVHVSWNLWGALLLSFSDWRLRALGALIHRVVGHVALEDNGYRSCLDKGCGG